jgi:hypothetical protein
MVNQQETVMAPGERSEALAIGGEGNAGGEGRWPWIALAVLLTVGLGLRVAMGSAASPAYVGFPDTQWYVLAAHFRVFGPGAVPTYAYHWPAGYPLFLKLLHAMGGKLTLVVVVQHGLGVLTALLLFSTVRRVASAAWGLLPAAVVLLAGPQLFLEHAILADTLFGCLVAGLLYAGARAYEGNQVGWAVLAGSLAAAAGTVRLVGLALIGAIVIWLLVGISGPSRQRLLCAAVAALAAVSLIGLYLGGMKRETGFGGPTLTNGGPYGLPPGADQPVGYLQRLGPDLARFWSSDANGENGGLDYDGFIRLVTAGPEGPLPEIPYSWYSTATYAVDTGALGALRGYQRHSRLEGIPFVLLTLLTAIGIPLARGRQLSIGLLMAAVSGVILVAPVLYAQFDARYVVPAYGPLAAVAALGAASLWQRLAPRLHGVSDRRGGVSIEPGSVT